MDLNGPILLVCLVCSFLFKQRRITCVFSHERWARVLLLLQSLFPWVTVFFLPLRSHAVCPWVEHACLSLDGEACILLRCWCVGSCSRWRVCVYVGVCPGGWVCACWPSLCVGGDLEISVACASCFVILGSDVLEKHTRFPNKNSKRVTWCKLWHKHWFP